MSNFTHLMLDEETMGTKSNAALVYLAAVFFDPDTGETGPEFKTAISLENCLKLGFSVDASTIFFWMKQSAEARAPLSDNPRLLAEALQRFTYFIEQNTNPRRLQVWGNGDAFDNVILRNAYAAIDVQPPWMFYNDQNVRTMVALGRHLGIDPKKTIAFEGEPHNAIDDAKHQISYVSAIWQQMALKKIDKRRKAK